MSDQSSFDAQGDMLMSHTRDLGAYAKALAGVQAEIENPSFDSRNSHYQSEYASLASCLRAIRPVLCKHGIAVSMMPISANGHVGVVTQFTHTSGQWMRCRLLLKPTKDDIHGQAAAVTYAKRYTLCGMAGVTADDDDDGNAAVQFDAKKAKGAHATVKDLTDAVYYWSAPPIPKDQIPEARRRVLRAAVKGADHIVPGYRPKQDEIDQAMKWIEDQRGQYPALQDAIDLT